MATGRIPIRNGGPGALHIAWVSLLCTIGMNASASLDPLSYREPSKYGICIIGTFCQEVSIFFLVQLIFPPPPGFTLQITGYLVTQRPYPQSCPLSESGRM